MDLDGNGSKTYRILKMDGNIAECIGMYDLSIQACNTNNTIITQNSVAIAKYASSDLDTYLNTTWYNTLNNVAKTAIVSKFITQDAWRWGNSSGLNYEGTYGDTVPGVISYTISKYIESEFVIGNRNVYALSLQDVINYLNDTNVQIDTTAMLRNVNIWKMFWNTEIVPTSNAPSSFWLRSGNHSASNKVWYVDRNQAFFTSTAVGGLKAVRPAFQIDLSKIPFTKTTEVIS